MPVGWRSSVFLDSAPHFLKRSPSLCFSQIIPRDAGTEQGRMGKEAPSRNEMLWVVKLEKKGLTRRKGLKQATAARLPEINFVKRGATPEKPKPVIIGDGNVGFQAPSLLSGSHRAPALIPWTDGRSLPPKPKAPGGRQSPARDHSIANSRGRIVESRGLKTHSTRLRVAPRQWFDRLTTSSG